MTLNFRSLVDDCGDTDEFVASPLAPNWNINGNWDDKRSALNWSSYEKFMLEPGKWCSALGSMAMEGLKSMSIDMCVRSLRSTISEYGFNEDCSAPSAQSALNFDQSCCGLSCWEDSSEDESPLQRRRLRGSEASRPSSVDIVDKDGGGERESAAFFALARLGKCKNQAI